MKKVLNSRRFFLLIGVCGLILFSVGFPAKHITAKKMSIEKDSLPNLSGDRAKDFLKEQGLYESLGEAIQAAKYSIYPAKYSSFESKNALHADNPQQGYSTYFSTDGVHLVSEAKGNEWKIKMNLEQIGRGEDLQEIESGEMNVQANKSEIKIEKFRVENQSEIKNPKSKIVEWYKNTSNGLEQGWTIGEKTGETEEELRLVLSVESDLQMKLANDSQAVDFVRKNNSPVVRYDKLKSWDADERELISRMEVGENQISLVVDDEHAKYPITVDPFFTQTKVLTASNAAIGDGFGGAVAVYGDMVIVGDKRNFVYIFERNTGGDWGEVKRITASDAALGDNFGQSVAISEDTIIVGAWGADIGGFVNAGAAYIFGRNTGGANNWGEVRKLVAPVAVAQDRFGISVGISGNTAVVGANQAIAAGDGGAAHIFVRNQGGVDTWGQVKEITAADTAPGDNFGFAVAISGDTVIIGAWGNDDIAGDTGSAYIFKQNTGGANNWGEVKKIMASDAASGDYFGYSVAISEDRAIIGAYGNDDNGNFRGSAYIFERNTGGANNWGEVKKMTSSTAIFLGWSVAISGDTAIVGSPQSNEAYIYERNMGGIDSWGEVQKLISTDAGSSNNFGDSVAVFGDSAIVGADGQLINNITSGSAYIFTNQDNNWQQVSARTSRDGRTSNQFGYSVAISGDRVVVGTPFDNAAGIVSGAAYVFYRNTDGTDSWGQLRRLTGTDTAVGDEFGYSVGINDDKIIVGSRFNDGNKGAAYIFYRNQGGADNWGQVKKLVAADANTFDQFGASVSISGTTAIVGAYGNDDNGSSSGSAYIFERNIDDRGRVTADFWGQRKKLLASDGGNLDFFGVSVSISGDTAIVGAFGENSDRGAAYLFGRNTGGVGNWGEIKKLTASNAAVSRYFGRSVSIFGDTLIVGALENTGGVYIFERNSDGSGGVLADNWGEVKKIVSPISYYIAFGYSVSIFNNRVIVSAPGDDENGSDSGAAYIFERNTGGADNWGEFRKLSASDGAAGDSFGWSVAISDDTAIAGSPLKDISATLTGKTKTFHNATEISSTNSEKNSSNLIGADQGGMYIFKALAAAPTAASAGISGRVTESIGGRGISDAIVYLTAQDGNMLTARTNSFGYFQFGEIEVGQTLIITASSRRYQFDAQVINFNDSISNLIITAK